MIIVLKDKKTGLDQHHRLDAKFAEVSRGPQRTAWVGFTSQNNGSVTKDDTESTEEARVSRHTKNNNNTVELQGALDRLEDHSERHTEHCNKTTEDIATCVGVEDTSQRSQWEMQLHTL